MNNQSPPLNFFYDSDEDVCWGPVTLREVKRDLKRNTKLKPDYRRQTAAFIPLPVEENPKMSSFASSQDYLTANESLESNNIGTSGQISGHPANNPHNNSDKTTSDGFQSIDNITDKMENSEVVTLSSDSEDEIMEENDVISLSSSEDEQLEHIENKKEEVKVEDISIDVVEEERQENEDSLPGNHSTYGMEAYGTAERQTAKIKIISVTPIRRPNYFELSYSASQAKSLVEDSPKSTGEEGNKTFSSKTPSSSLTESDECREIEDSNDSACCDSNRDLNVSQRENEYDYCEEVNHTLSKLASDLSLRNSGNVSFSQSTPSISKKLNESNASNNMMYDSATSNHLKRSNIQNDSLTSVDFDHREVKNDFITSDNSSHSGIRNRYVSAADSNGKDDSITSIHSEHSEKQNYFFTAVDNEHSKLKDDSITSKHSSNNMMYDSLTSNHFEHSNTQNDSSTSVDFDYLKVKNDLTTSDNSSHSGIQNHYVSAVDSNGRDDSITSVHSEHSGKQNYSFTAVDNEHSNLKNDSLNSVHSKHSRIQDYSHSDVDYKHSNVEDDSITSSNNREYSNIQNNAAKIFNNSMFSNKCKDIQNDSVTSSRPSNAQDSACGIDDNQANDSLNDTFSEMQRLLQEGFESDSDDSSENIIDSTPYKTNHSLEISAQKYSKIPVPTSFSDDSRSNLSLKSDFKVPKFPPKLTKKTPIGHKQLSAKTSPLPLKNIISPVRLYINNSPFPTLKQTNKPGCTRSHTLDAIAGGPKVIPKIHRNLLDSLPELVYKPSKLVKEKCDNQIILPKNIKKLITERTVIKHEPRRRINFDDSMFSVEEKLRMRDLSCIVSDDQNMSVHVNKQGFNL